MTDMILEIKDFFLGPSIPDRISLSPEEVLCQTGLPFELPAEILLEIFTLLSPQDLMNAGLVCFQWRAFCSADFFSKEFFIKTSKRWTATGSLGYLSSSLTSRRWMHTFLEFQRENQFKMTPQTKNSQIQVELPAKSSLFSLGRKLFAPKTENFAFLGDGKNLSAKNLVYKALFGRNSCLAIKKMYSGANARGRRGPFATKGSFSLRKLFF
eukprot:TRINITY_DN1609_c0_g1_i2.p1 TRINITY_DN1609_c0_g1~~TRINITY_DN1609_c0_g1_i2.p1  ORF type:complete len:218 (-),score=40.99 TRINITY_DN1609_c0_g1_i2:480-1112(-)